MARVGHLGAGNEWNEQEVPLNTVGDVQNSQLNSGDEVALVPNYLLVQAPRALSR